ncbi:unnamed protein product [Sphagnum troendelagicum]|uniref:Uncharacterized protein n=1 Tax=Sphagnum troendelagicum TaxID=128251 RepID=A0ABP0V2R3_9BRYO
MARNILFFGSCRLSSSRHNTRTFPRRPQSLFLLAAAKSLHRFSANEFHFQSAKFRKPPSLAFLAFPQWYAPSKTPTRE